MKTFLFAIFVSISCLSFAQMEQYDELFMNLYGKDSLKVEILSTAKYFKSFNYQMTNDTLVINVKLGILKNKKEFNNIIKLDPQTNYVNLNKVLYYIEPNYTFKTPSYKLVKLPKPEEKKE